MSPKTKGALGCVALLFILGIGAFAIGVLIVVAGAGVAWLSYPYSSAPPPAIAQTTPPIEAPTPREVKPIDAPVEPSPTHEIIAAPPDHIVVKEEPRSSTPPTTTEAKSQPVVARETPPAIDPKPTPEPRSETVKSSVSASGADEVVLLRKGKRYAIPGSVEPGRYEIEARFGDEPSIVVGSVTVRDGPVSITCNPRMGVCRAAK